MRITIVGAGVIGLSIARELAEHATEVTVVEAARPGAGTSGTSFAWVNSHAKEPLSYHELNVAGVRAHQELHAAHPDGPRWYRPTGNLEWAETEGHQQALDASVERLRARGYPAEWIDPRRARELEPGARIPDTVDTVAFFPDEGHIQPVEYLARMLGDARARGARVLCPARVREVSTGGTGARLTLDDGATIDADVVVSAVGRWTEDLAATAGASVPMAVPDLAGAATVGYLAYTEPVPARLDRVLTTSRLNVRPDGGGRLVLQGLDLDAGADPAVPVLGPGSGVARELAERLPTILAGGEYARVTEVRVGQRALPADGLTVCGFADAHRRLYTVATHSGVTLAPALAPLVAREVLGDETSEALADFRPGRFAADPPTGAGPTPARVPGQQ